MNYRYLPEARQELDRHIAQYEQKEAGLGLKFLDEVVSGVGRIIINPQAWTEIETDIRRYLTEKFPYAILYHVEEDKQEIIIIAIMHQRQRPGYWRSREF